MVKIDPIDPNTTNRSRIIVLVCSDVQNVLKLIRILLAFTVIFCTVHIR